MQQKQGESYAAFKERERKHNLERDKLRAPRRKVARKRRASKSEWDRNANIVDGFDRDDTGESPDY